jgi:hypothetical protein
MGRVWQFDLSAGKDGKQRFPLFHGKAAAISLILFMLFVALGL